MCIVDDLLATGGTIEAVEKLIKRSHANTVCSLFLIELTKLHGRDKLTPEVFSLLQYDI